MRTFMCLRPDCWLVYTVERGEEVICPRCNAKMAKKLKNRKAKPKDHWKSRQNKAQKILGITTESFKTMDKQMKGIGDQDYKDLAKDIKKNLKDIRKEI
jgi:hypothetical protein